MIRRVLAPALLLAGSLIGACSDDPNPTAPTPTGVNQLFTMAPGDTVNVRDASMDLHFSRVVKDERCPADALCVAGLPTGATLAVTVRLESRTQPYEITTLDNGRVLGVGDYRIELVTLAPYPFSSGTPIQPADYRATLRVTSRE